MGVSGWRYPPWRGSFYPAGLPQRSELAYASRALSTIEINGSFYALQRPSSWQAWHDETPEDFVFAIKGPRYITHILRLRDETTPLANFFASGIGNLGHKLGPILWQLPPTLSFDADAIGNFLRALPRDADAATSLARRHDDKVKDRASLSFRGVRDKLRHAMEVRHPSFATPAFTALLRKHGVAWVIADTGRRWPEFDDVTGDFVYLRLHGATGLYRSRYCDAALKRWSKRLVCWSSGSEPVDGKRIGPAPRPRRARDVFCYFDNTDKQHAPRNAEHLASLTDDAPRQ